MRRVAQEEINSLRTAMGNLHAFLTSLGAPWLSLDGLSRFLSANTPRICGVALASWEEGVGARIQQCASPSRQGDVFDERLLCGQLPEILRTQGLQADGLERATPCGIECVALRIARHDNHALFFAREGENWPEDDVPLLRLTADAAALALDTPDGGEQQMVALYIRAICLLLDRIRTNVFISDIEDDHLIFVNKSMKKNFGLSAPEGQICWKLLQKGMDGRCPFCPVHRLSESTMDRPSMVWEEVNSLTGRTYENHDCLIRWPNGQAVHLQYSAETKPEILGVKAPVEIMDRRVGARALARLLDLAEQERKTVSVCIFGADAQALFLNQADVLFCLDGSTLVAALYDVSNKEAAAMLIDAADTACLLEVRPGGCRLSLGKDGEPLLFQGMVPGRVGDFAAPADSPRAGHSMTRSQELLLLLQSSVARDFEGFSLHYQPQISVDAQEVSGAEALARWHCEKYGNISPGEFFPLLEQSGLFMAVGRWMLRHAVRCCRDWITLVPDFVMSVNLSYLQLREPGFISFMKRMLDEYNVPSANLVVELTESYQIRSSGDVREIFDRLRGLGVRIAMDDFGTGYSSLEILKNAPADIVKIDQTFSRDIGKNSSFDAVFIRFIVALCHNMGVLVCLEGVETEEEYAIVSPMNLDYMQGFLFGHPEPAEVFREKYLRGR